MVGQVNAKPTTSQGYTKITNKLQDNQPQESSEDELNRTPVTKATQKRRHQEGQEEERP